MFKTLTNFEKLKFIFSILVMITGVLLCFYAIFFLPKQIIESTVLKIVFPGLIAIVAAFVTSFPEEKLDYRIDKMLSWISVATGWIFVVIGIMLFIAFVLFSFTVNIRDSFMLGLSIVSIIVGILQIISRSNNVFTWVVLLGGSIYFIKNICAALPMVDSIVICGVFFFIIGILFFIPFAIQQAMRTKRESV